MTTINGLCRKTSKVNLLNAFHACRSGHPLNNAYQWREHTREAATQSPENTRAKSCKPVPRRVGINSWF